MIAEDKKAIQQFLMNINILDEITSRFKQFNVFETLGAVDNELRHSNVIAWFLNPNENHGLGDIFIKNFVQKIAYDYSELTNCGTLTFFEASMMDYSDFYVLREWKNVDILAVSEKNKVVIVVENKVWSKESKYQLEKYYHIIQQEYPQYQALFLFLTPMGETASDEANWIAVDYTIILDILQKALSVKQENISTEIKLFIQQYMNVLRRYIVGDNELEKICKDIYYKHQKALDLIFAYKPDVYSEIADGIKDYLKSKQGIILDDSNKSYVRFTTEKLDKKIAKKGEGWTSSKRILLFELQICKNDKLVFKLYIGPGDSDMRQRLYEIAQGNNQMFKGMGKQLGAKWTQIYHKEIMQKNYLDKHHQDTNEILDEIYKKIEKLLSDDVLEMETYLINNYA